MADFNDFYETIEINCNDCGKFFMIHLHVSWGGKQVLVQCPNEKCGRKHPRMLHASDTGEMTAMTPNDYLYKHGEGQRLKRNGGTENQGILIIGLKSTLSDESRYDKVNFSKNERDKGGFLSRLWCRAASKEGQ